MRNHWIIRFWPWAAVIVAVLIVFGRLVGSPGSILADGERPSVDRYLPPEMRGPGNDLTRWFLPHHLWIIRGIAASGGLPGWDPSGFGGRPLIGNAQAGTSYPGAWLYWLSRIASVPGWVTLGHLVWAGWGMLVLGRQQGLSRRARVLAAAVVAIGPYAIAHVMEGHYAHVWSASWYPWAFWALVQWQRGGRIAAWGLPVFVAASCLTGHVQEGFYLLLALAACEAVFVVRRAWGGRVPWGHLATGCVVAAIVAATTAPEWLPVALSLPWQAGGVPGAEGQSAHYHVQFSNLAQLLHPWALGPSWAYFGPSNYWETVLSVGWTTLLLAIIGARYGRPRRTVLAWSALGGAAIAFAFGPLLGLEPLLRSFVPGVDRFRVPARALFVALPCVGLLAGRGLDALSRGGRKTWRGLAARSAVVAIVLGGVILLGAGGDMRRGWSVGRAAGDLSAVAFLRQATRSVAEQRVVALVLAAPVALLLAGTRVAGWRTRLATGMGVLAVAELLLLGVGAVQVARVERFTPESLRAALEPMAVAPTRRACILDNWSADLTAATLGIETVWVHDAFQLEHAIEIVAPLYPLQHPRRRAAQGSDEQDEARRREQRALRLLAVEEVVVASGEDLQIGGVERRSPLNSRPWVGRVAGAMPRAYVVPGAAVARVPSRERLMELDLRERVLLPSDPLVDAPGPRQAFRPVSYHAEGPDRLELRVRTEAPGLLVVADTWMPGWSATVDGWPVPILRGNVAQRVVPLRQAGEHRVAMRYRAPGRTSSLVGCGAGLTLWLGWGAWLWRSRGRKGRPGGVAGPSQ